jgi:hypothetical protein
MNVQNIENIVTKAEFATICGVSAGRVSQWISEGKIPVTALVGVGRAARIDVALAQQSIALKTDVGQRFGNGLTTNLQPKSLISPSTFEPCYQPKNDFADDLDEQIKKAKLQEVLHRNRRNDEDEAERRGHYIEAEQARREIGSAASAILQIFEGSLAELASAISLKFEISQRDVLHLLKQEFIAVRRRSAETLQRQAQSLPETIEMQSLTDIAAHTS